MNPGQGSICRACLYFSATGWNEGHPNPCRLNAWRDEQHYSPAIAADGKACEDYRQRGKVPRPVESITNDSPD
jgi:hypothetical protein